MKKITLYALVLIYLSLSPALLNAQWQQTSAPVTGGASQSICLNGSNFYVGTVMGGILVSTDSGNTWAFSNNGLTGLEIGRIAVNGAYIFASTDSGVYLSTNNGASWTKRSAGIPVGGIIEAMAVNGTTVFAGLVGQGIYLSKDSGITWTAANNGLANGYVFGLTSYGGNIYAGVDTIFYESTDNGTTWVSYSTGIINTFVGAISFLGNKIFAGSTGMFMSDNGGSTWTPINASLPTTQVNSIVALNGWLYAGTYGNGVYLSTDSGVNWTPYNTSLTDTFIWGLAVFNNTLFAATSLHGGVWKIALTQSCTQQPPLQSLCVVTCDTTSTQNVVIWDKADKYATDSFYIYRADTPDSNYVQIAAIGRDSLSEYNDITSQPMQMSYRYKINLLDTCGHFSILSPYHQTIYLQYSGTGNFTWTPYTVENSISPVTGYDFYRDSTGTGNWQLLSSLPNTQTTASDPYYAQYPNAKYKVVATLVNACNPSRSITNITSNILSHLPLGLIFPAHENAEIIPNPAHDKFEVLIPDPGSNLQSVILLDQLGNKFAIPCSIVVKGRINVDISQLSAGLYYVLLNYDNTVVSARVIKY